MINNLGLIIEKSDNNFKQLEENSVINWDIYGMFQSFTYWNREQNPSDLDKIQKYLFL